MKHYFYHFWPWPLQSKSRSQNSWQISSHGNSFVRLKSILTFISARLSQGHRGQLLNWRQMENCSFFPLTFWIFNEKFFYIIQQKRSYFGILFATVFHNLKHHDDWQFPEFWREYFVDLLLFQYPDVDIFIDLLL